MTRYGAGYLPDRATHQDPALIVGDGNSGIDGGTVIRIAWFRLDWPRL